MLALRIENLVKSFGGLNALANVYLNVETGSRRVIIGPNGAGKTTLFNIISGYIPPSSGEIYFFDQNITFLPAHRRAHLGIGRTFQINNLFPNLTVLQNAILAIQAVKGFRYKMFHALSSYKQIHTRSQELLSERGLWGKRDFTIQDLSYGEQRQLEIILGLAFKPKLLLMDEPTAGLSMEEAKNLLNMIKNLDLNITVILISHDIDLALDFADRVTALDYGSVIFEGTSEEVQRDQKVNEIYTGIKPTESKMVF